MQTRVLYRKVARKVLSETLHVKKGEALTVEAWNNGVEFGRIVVAEARAIGCTAVMLFEDEDAHVEGVRRSPSDMVGLMGKNEYNLLAGTDAYVFIPGQALAAYSRTLSPAEQANSTRYNSSWYDAAKAARLRGARLTFGYVGRDMARMLGRDIDDIVRSQLMAALTDYGEISQTATALSSTLSDGTNVELDSQGATLRFALKGALTVDDGIVDEKDLAIGNNMAYIPPGLVTKGVDPDSVEGKLKVSRTLTKYGVLGGAELEFKGGRLMRWKSREGTKLRKLLTSVPEDKRRLSLLGVGINPVLNYGFGQDRFVRGAVTLGGLGFNALMRGSSLSIGGRLTLSRGTLTA